MTEKTQLILPVQNTTGRIDVHAHYITDQYRAALIAAGHEHPDGMPAIPAWNVTDALAMMDKNNIQTQMLSISSPGVNFGNNEEARKMARLVNEEGAQIVKDHPGRFGLFASLPLPDVEGAIEELHYALGVLKADGVVLESNAHGMYLGDEKMEQIFAVLNEYKTTAFIHPTSPTCSCNTPSFNYPAPMLEFLFETSRTITNLLLNGLTKRYPEVKVIVPHAGGTLPVLADRIAGFMPMLKTDPEVKNGDEFFRLLKELYFDLAGQPTPRLLPALLSFADETHIMYGSDYCFTPAETVAMLIGRLESFGLSEQQLRMFMRDNALEVFPRLRDEKL